MGLLVDASTPGTAATSATGGSVGQAITSCPANALILAVSAHNTTSGVLTADATVSGGGLTWTQKAKASEADTGGAAGLCALNWARNGGSTQTFTATVSSTNTRGEVALQCWVLTGALAASDPLNVVKGFSDNTTNLSVAITTTAANSICVGGLSDWWASTTYTAPTGFTTQSASIVNGNIGYWNVRANGNQSSGATVTFACSNASSTARNNFLAIEVLEDTGGVAYMRPTIVVPTGAVQRSYGW
jgi:hypothetical protein